MTEKLDQFKQKIIEKAKQGNFTYYQEFGKELGITAQDVGMALEEVLTIQVSLLHNLHLPNSNLVQEAFEKTLRSLILDSSGGFQESFDETFRDILFNEELPGLNEDDINDLYDSFNAIINIQIIDQDALEHEEFQGKAIIKQKKVTK